MRAIEFMSEWKTTSEIAAEVNRPTTTVKLLLEDLMVVGVLNRKTKKDDKRSPYMWQLADQICEWIGQAEIFEDVKV